MRSDIIDLSHNNDTVDMHDLVENHGVKMFILKVNQGSFQDPACRALAARVRSVNAHLGLYSFLNDDPGADQMTKFIADAAGLGSVTVWLDYEESAQQASHVELEDSVQWLVSNKGRHPAIYSDSMFAQAMAVLGPDSGAALCPGWLANVSGNKPSMPSQSRGELVGWQWGWKFLGGDLDVSEWESSTNIDTWVAAHVITV